MLDREQLYRTAELAMLELTEREVSELSEAVSAMLEYAAVMELADTAGLSPTVRAPGEQAPLRADEPVQGGVGPDELLKRAPERDSRFFTIPGVL
jgi:aspartyl/glutamyl-tRNA(Asn/Gln) amidotransferase C subunit